jgi:hypothetical protein
LGLHLCDDGNLDLGCVPLYGDGLFRSFQPLDITLDGALGNGSRVLQVLASVTSPGRAGTVTV